MFLRQPPSELPEEFVNPLNPGDPGVENAPLNFLGFSGTIYDLLRLYHNVDAFHALFGTATAGGVKYVGPLSFKALRAQLVHQGMQYFENEIKRIVKVSFTHDRLGIWKLADQYSHLFLRKTTFDEEPIKPDGLVDALRVFASKQIEDDLGFEGGTVFNTTLSHVYRNGPYSDPSEEGDQILAVGTLARDSAYHHVPAGFADIQSTEPHRHVVYAKGRTAWRIDYTGRNSEQKLMAVTPFKITPQHDGPKTILPARGEKELDARRSPIAEAYEKLSGAPASVRMYLVEAYRLVPLRLAGALQEANAFDEALAWYNLVYAHRAARGVRKIDHGLVLEEELDFAFDELDRWLGNTANVHGIAATRKETWTRHVIISIAGCLIDQADALFATDAPPDLTRAAELYKQALNLLSHFPEPSSICDTIIGRLEIDITDGIGLPLDGLRFALARIGNEARLRPVADDLRAIALDTGADRTDRIARIRRRLSEAVAAEPQPASIAERVDTGRLILGRAEELVLASPTMRAPLERAVAARYHRRRHASEAVAALRVPRDGGQMTWLRRAPESSLADVSLTAVERDSPSVATLVEFAPMRSLSIAEPPPPPLAGLTVSFCVPQNPLVDVLRGRAENNLEKLRTCRNIAGFERELDPYGGPIGLGAGVGRDGVLTSRVQAPNTAYRYAALRERAMELINEAEQVEARYQANLVAAEEAEFRELQFRQQVKLSAARTRLADLRIDAAAEQVALAGLQQSAAAFTARTYGEWIDAGANQHEQDMLRHYKEAEDAQLAANRARTVGAVANATANASGAFKGGFKEKLDPTAYISAASFLAAAAAAGAEGAFNAQNIRAQTDIQQASFMASQARREQEWALQKGRAEYETQIASQQIVIAQSQLRITQRERDIAAIEQSNAEDLLEYLIGMDFTAELYRWMAAILGRIYRGFLQQATAIARLAEAQDAFEQLRAPAGLIKTDYWAVTPSATQPAGPEAASRLGLTGAARLRYDMQTLEQQTFDHRSRQDRWNWTIDLAQHAPIEFQRFRDTGRMVFEISLAMLELEFPGHFLCLIRSVTISVVALVPPARGIRASLTSSGITDVVVEGDTYRTVTLNSRPERVAFTGTSETTGHVPLSAQDAALRGAFEGIGMGRWLLEMQRAVNPFDFDSIATVLVTFEITSRFSFEYERQLLEARDPRVEGEVAFGFRHQFPDAWYDLLNPDLTSEPMRVRFRTDGRSFPRNVLQPRIAALVVYVVRADGETVEFEGAELRFRPDGENGRFGGIFSTVDGRSSTRAASGIGLVPILGRPVAGEWELALPDDPNMEFRPRNLLAEERVTDLLLVITFAGQEVPWEAY